MKIFDLQLFALNEKEFEEYIQSQSGQPLILGMLLDKINYGISCVDWTLTGMNHDCLESITEDLSRIADALEEISNKM